MLSNLYSFGKTSGIRNNRHIGALVIYFDYTNEY